MADPATVIVTIAHGRHDHLQAQRRLLTRFHPQAHHVVVAMADPQIPALVGEPGVTVIQVAQAGGKLPLAAARNQGMAAALHLNPELVILLDVDCVLDPGAVSAYSTAAKQVPSALLCGPVTYLPGGVSPPDDPAALRALRHPHEARPAPDDGQLIRGGEYRLFWSLNFAVTPATWERLGGFHEGYRGYGGEDTDLAWTARERDVEIVWVGGADAYHQHHPVSSPPVEHTEDIVRNARIFHDRWGEWPMQGWLDSLTEQGHIRWVSGIPEAIVAKSN